VTRGTSWVVGIFLFFCAVAYVFIKRMRPAATICDANTSANHSVAADCWGKNWRARSVGTWRLLREEDGRQQGLCQQQRHIIKNYHSLYSDALTYQVTMPPFSSHQQHLTMSGVWDVHGVKLHNLTFDLSSRMIFDVVFLQRWNSDWTAYLNYPGLRHLWKQALWNK
jgi:hypothetical protein